MPYPDRYYEILLKEMQDWEDEGWERPQVVRRLIEFHDRERAVNWNTTCIGCADLLDKLYELESSQEACCPNVGEGKHSFQDIKDQQLFVDTVGDDLL